MIKYRTDEPKVSLLGYPDFVEDFHPALRHGMTIQLVRVKVRHTAYAGKPQPTILHRKEGLLPAAHRKPVSFASLTKAQEAEGLCENTPSVGYKLGKDRLVASKGLGYR